MFGEVLHSFSSVSPVAGPDQRIFIRLVNPRYRVTGAQLVIWRQVVCSREGYRRDSSNGKGVSASSHQIATSSLHRLTHHLLEMVLPARRGYAECRLSMAHLEHLLPFAILALRAGCPNSWAASPSTG